MFKRFSEPSTYAGLGVAALTAFQHTGSWQFSLMALISALGAIFVPEVKAK